MPSFIPIDAHIAKLMFIFPSKVSDLFQQDA